MKQTKIPLVDLTAQHRSLKSQIERALRTVVQRSDFILGEDLKQFESEFARFTGTRYAIGISCGLDAIRLVLSAMNIGPGDEVIVPAHTYIATALAVSHTGAFPRFVDVEEDTCNLDPKKIEATITPKTRAIVPVHLYGQPADMDPIMKIARKHHLSVIEDACQAHGARYKVRRTGSMGDAGCFSFYPSKNLGALGDGGMITTNDATLAQKLDRLRNYGQSRKYVHDEVGYNNRLDTMHAAILRLKLQRLDAWNKKRKAIANVYNRALAKLPMKIPVVHPAPNGAGGDHVYHLYTIQSDRRDQLQSFLTGRGISTGIYYPIPMHLQKCYANLGYKTGDFPVAERLSREILALPMYPEMTAAQVKTVCRAVTEFFRGTPSAS